ncbi:hypothetical protein NDU88_009434 [Pleurodeles waltl]|uniref:Uncharacterized protein n=1 Tax=Pleurodeles waltl TaxID=8319 RepID=A0AAV7QSP2_PLEWA|nr:hypothetical protein NDU88_009434 [Pleurodeles waltl]
MSRTNGASLSEITEDTTEHAQTAHEIAELALSVQNTQGCRPPRLQGTRVSTDSLHRRYAELALCTEHTGASLPETAEDKRGADRLHRRYAELTLTDQNKQGRRSPRLQGTRWCTGATQSSH